MNWTPEQRLELDPAIEEFIRRKQAAKDIQGGLAAMPSPSAPPPAPVVAPPVAKAPSPFDIPPEVEQELKSYDAEQQRAATKREFQNGMDRAQAYFTGRPVPARETPQVDDSIRKFILSRKLGAGAKAGEAPVTDAEVAALVSKSKMDPAQAQALRADPGNFRKVAASYFEFHKDAAPGLEQHPGYVARGAALKSKVEPTQGEKPSDFAKRVEEQERLEGKGNKEVSDNVRRDTLELRKEFNAHPAVKDMETAATAYKKVKTTSETGAGDISLIFAYMKMLDPGSTVREGEFATAANAGSIPQSVVAAYNKAVNGEKLAAPVRQMFKDEARTVYAATRDRYKLKASEYRRLAKENGLNPDHVVTDMGLEEDPAAPSAPGEPRPGDEFLPRR